MAMTGKVFGRVRMIWANGLPGVLVVCASLFFSLLSSRPSPLSAAEPVQAAVAAKVNGVPITQMELEKAIDTYIPAGAYHGGVAMQKRREYRKPALDLLIDNELLSQEAKARGLTVEDKTVDAAIEQIRKRYRDEKSLERALKAAGITLAELRKITARNELIRSILKSEVEEKSRYSEKELEDYFNANRGKFMRPEGFHIRHILLTIPSTATDAEKIEIRKKADDIFKRAKAGEDFAALASRYSQDAYRVKGGDLGFVHKGRLDPVVEETAFKLAPGEVGIGESIYGCHIVKLEEKKPAEQLTFPDVRDSLRKELESKRYKETKEALLKGLKEKAKIEIYEETSPANGVKENVEGGKKAE